MYIVHSHVQASRRQYCFYFCFRIGSFEKIHLIGLYAYAIIIYFRHIRVVCLLYAVLLVVAD